MSQNNWSVYWTVDEAVDNAVYWSVFWSVDNALRTVVTQSSRSPR